MPIKDEDERGRRPLDEAEAIQAARTAFRAAGRAEAEMPLVADGQSLPHFWLVLPAAPERGRTYKSASVDPDDGAVKIGDYEVIEAPITRRER